MMQDTGKNKTAIKAGFIPDNDDVRRKREAVMAEVIDNMPLSKDGVMIINDKIGATMDHGEILYPTD